MLAVSAVITNRVLARLGDNQEQNLEQLASAYLDGLSASLIPSVFREDVWEVFDTLDRSRERYKGLNVKWTIVTNADGKILAASDPTEFLRIRLPKKRYWHISSKAKRSRWKKESHCFSYEVFVLSGPRDR